MKKTRKKVVIFITVILLLCFSVTVFADSGNVSAAIKETWTSASSQIKEVTNSVIFPVIDCVLAILLFVKLAMSYFEYKKHGEFEFTGAAILFFGLLFAMTAPLYVWNIIGI